MIKDRDVNLSINAKAVLIFSSLIPLVSGLSAIAYGQADAKSSTLCTSASCKQQQSEKLAAKAAKSQADSAKITATLTDLGQIQASLLSSLATCTPQPSCQKKVNAQLKAINEKISALGTTQNKLDSTASADLQKSAALVSNTTSSGHTGDNSVTTDGRTLLGYVNCRTTNNPACKGLTSGCPKGVRPAHHSFPTQDRELCGDGSTPDYTSALWTPVYSEPASLCNYYHYETRGYLTGCPGGHTWPGLVTELPAASSH